MGLMDVINGMQHGPHGSGSSTTAPQDSGGMSPMTMAILGLLAWKAIKHFTQPSTAPTQTPIPSPNTGGSVAAGPAGGSGGLGGGLGDVLKGGLGGLGGLLAGGAAANTISGGLGDLVNSLQQGGHGDTANSWVGKGANRAISPDDLANALGSDQIDQLSTQSGLPRDELLSGLSKYLPQVVDHLTPDGRLPTESELSGRI